MQKHRFYAPKNQISGNRAFLSAEEAHHLSRVLRLAAGDEVYIFDGEGADYKCRISAVTKDRVEVDVVETLKYETESPVHITLAQALAKGEKFDLVVQKATELGVSEITPLETEHTDVRLRDERTEKKTERWRRISLEALKQCGRSRLVRINPPVTVGELLSQIKAKACLALLFSEQGGHTIGEAIERTIGGKHDLTGVAALVGPEGGWSAEELALMIESGCVPVTLGPRILRTETAAIVAVTLIQHHLGDLSSVSGASE